MNFQIPMVQEGMSMYALFPSLKCPLERAKIFQLTIEHVIGQLHCPIQILHLNILEISYILILMASDFSLKELFFSDLLPLIYFLILQCKQMQMRKNIFIVVF